MRNEEVFDLSIDAVVIGGGVIGLSIARELSGAGLRVAVVERGRAGREASHAAAGMLAPQAEANEPDAFFELARESRRMYPAFAAELKEETGVDVELDETGTLYLALTEADEAEILHRYRWQRDARMEVELLTLEQARAREPYISPHVRRALFFPHDGQVENRRLVTALASSIERRGARLLMNTEVFAVETKHGRADGVITSRGRIKAEHVIIASGAWANSLRRVESKSNDAVQHDEELSIPSIEPVRGQMLCFDSVPPLVRHVVYTPRAYLVPRRDGRLLAGATTERVGFVKGVTAAGLHTLTTNALEISPAVGDLPVVDSWSGLRPRAADGLPIIGRAAGIENLTLAIGHYRNGILLAPLTGKLVRRSIIENHSSSFLEAFASNRLEQNHSTPAGAPSLRINVCAD